MLAFNTKQARLEYLFLILAFFTRVSFCLTPDIDCDKDCGSDDYTNPNYKPQECALKCSDKTFVQRDDFGELRHELNTLRIMVIILLSLVVLLILLFMMVFVRKMKLKQIFRKFYPKKCKNSDLEKGKCDDKLKDAVIYSNTSNSVIPLESPQITSSVRGESPSKSGQELSIDMRRKRDRMPSESTCPDESQIEHTGYDNLALSTSTINFHSRPSSPSSPNDVTSSTDTVDISMNPLNTTMTTVQIDYGEDSSTRTTIT